MTGEVIKLRSVRTQSGHPSTLQALHVIAHVSRLEDQVRDSAQRLQALAMYDDPQVRRAANSALATLLDYSLHPNGVEDRLPRTLAFRGGRHLESRLRAIRYRVGRGRGLPPLVHRMWTALGLGLTCAISVAILHHSWVLAAALTIVRVAVSLLLGQDADLPFEKLLRSPVAGADWIRGERDRSQRSPVYRSGMGMIARCVTGHICDALPLLAVAWVLTVSAQPFWAAGVVISTFAMLIATLFRVGGLQVGTPMERLSCERVARVGSLVIGLILTAVLQPSLPIEGTPLVTFVALGPLLFAALETVRGAYRLGLDNRCAGDAPIKVVLSVLDHSGVHNYVKTLYRAA
jgi:hypothetical protein